MKPQAVLFVVACWMTSGSSMTTDPITVDPVGNAQFFENQILPLLTQHCYECHNTNNAAANGQLAFDSRTSLLRGGTRGPVLLAGKPYESLLNSCGQVWRSPVADAASGKADRFGN